MTTNRRKRANRMILTPRGNRLCPQRNSASRLSVFLDHHRRPAHEPPKTLQGVKCHPANKCHSKRAKDSYGRHSYAMSLFVSIDVACSFDYVLLLKNICLLFLQSCAENIQNNTVERVCAGSTKTITFKSSSTNAFD